MGFTILHRTRWLTRQNRRVVGSGYLSPLPLRDISDRIALTNRHLSASVTQRQIMRSEMRLSQSATL